MRRLTGIISILMLLMFTLTNSMSVFAQKDKNKPFVVVIDAGHGGKDNGASGKKKLREKDINLAVALKLGKMINQIKGVRVYYTRKTDVFVPLADRANYANDLKADLFISIHTNSAETRSARGTEVYSFSPSSTDVAMRENSVMELEENYKKKYDGFDPNSSESYIQWDLIASDFGYSGQSKKFASYISNEFKKNCPLQNRGIHQAGFWVLKYSNMPGVLVEVGYVSNLEEEKWLRKDANRDALAQSVYNAFVKYKADYDKKTSTSAEQKQSKNNDITKSESNSQKSKTNAQASKSSSLTTGVHYKVQLYTGQRKSMLAPEFKSWTPAQEYPLTNGNFTYMYGDETNYADAKQLLAKIKKDFKDAFLVVFKDGKRLEPNAALKYMK